MSVYLKFSKERQNLIPSLLSYLEAFRFTCCAACILVQNEMKPHLTFALNSLILLFLKLMLLQMGRIRFVLPLKSMSREIPITLKPARSFHCMGP